MGDFDDPRALERALATIVQEIIGNVSLDDALAPDAAAKAVTAATAMAAVDKLSFTKPQTVLGWLRATRKQIAPHADKVPLPIVQGLARTIFPPAQAVVPVIRYLQTPTTSKVATSSGAVSPTFSSPGPSQQIFIIPIVQKAPPPHPQVRALLRTIRGVGVWAQRNPILAVGLVYATYRSRGVPGKVVRALDRAVNILCAWVWMIALKATRRQRMWVSKTLTEAKEKAQGYVPSPLRPPGTVTAAGEDSLESEGRVKLDVGDAIWVVITAIVAIYVTVNRQKIFKRR